MKRLQTQALRLSKLMLLALLVIGFSACDANIAGTEAKMENDLVARTSGADFTTLSQAIEAARLTATLRAGDPFTVFAPTDEAFARLPESALRKLLLPQNRKQLAELLTTHVVPGRVYARDVFELSSAKTLDGTDLNFEQEGDAIYVNDARIIATDLEATNGVIHAIDTVLLPEWFDSWLSHAAAPYDPPEIP